MKSFAAAGLAAAALCALGWPSHAATLVTRNYSVQITPLCGEAVVDCEQFAYAGTHNRNGSRINMTGKPAMRACGPREAGCDPAGYLFYNGGVSYFVGQDGWLIVNDGNRSVLRERGNWKD